MKEQILKLRSEGKSYGEIVKLLSCKKSMVQYHCGLNQKENNLKRQRKNKQNWHPYRKKLYNFYLDKRIKKKTKTYSKLTLTKILRRKINNFYEYKKGDYMDSNYIKIEDIINKFGENPKCYLTGQPIDINKPRTYEFDHIVPKSKGGTNTIDNLGICIKNANRAKAHMTPDEFIQLCKNVVEHQGYKLIKE